MEEVLLDLDPEPGRVELELRHGFMTLVVDLDDRHGGPPFQR
jgi:hypothetical protein